MTDKPLKIAMLSAHSCPVGDLGARDTGGMSVYIRELARQLGAQGHSVDVYTRTHDPRDPVVFGLGEQANLIHLRAGEVAPIHKLAVYCYLPEFTCHLENYRRNNGLEYDICFSHYWLSGWVGRYLARWWRVPHVIMFHTLGAVKNATGVGEDAPELRTVAEREAVGYGHRIIAATEREKGELAQYYNAPPEKVGVVPCGVNLELFRPSDRRAARRELGLGDEKIILFVGRLDPLKGIDRLLRAMTHLRDSDNLRLIIIGGDERSLNERERLSRLAARLGIEDRVTFRGMVRQELLPGYYRAADCCVVPSYHESFGLVALEALACGTPVVSSDVGEMRNIILPGQTGYVVSDNRPEALAEKIARVLSWPPRDAAAMARIRASVARFGWASIAAAVAGELRQALSGKLAVA
jgi:D-inositol-3-phosphate glycosyltransferase